MDNSSGLDSQPVSSRDRQDTSSRVSERSRSGGSIHHSIGMTENGVDSSAVESQPLDVEESPIEEKQDSLDNGDEIDKVVSQAISYLHFHYKLLLAD